MELPLRRQADGNILHLQSESCGRRGPSIPSLVRLAEYIQDVGRVGAKAWLPIPALLQQHPDGVRDPQRRRIRGLQGPISVLYLRHHREISALAKGDLPRQNLCEDEIPGRGERAARAYFVDHHPHPIDVAGHRSNNLQHVILVRPLKLRRSPPPP